MKILKSFIESEWEKQSEEAQTYGIDFHVQGAITSAEYLTVYLRKDEKVAFIETDIFDEKHCLIVELKSNAEIDYLKQKAKRINEFLLVWQCSCNMGLGLPGIINYVMLRGQSARFPWKLTGCLLFPARKSAIRT